MKAVWTEIAQRLCNRTSLIALCCVILIAVLMMVLSIFCRRHKEENQTSEMNTDYIYIKSINPRANFTP